jgi:hypothetical protein
LNGSAQRLHRLIAAARGAAGHRKFQVSGGRTGLLSRQRLEHIEGKLGLAGDPASGAQNQARMRVSRYRLEDFTGLFRGQCGIPLEQSRGVSERNVYRSNGLRSAVQ